MKALVALLLLLLIGCTQTETSLRKSDFMILSRRVLELEKRMDTLEQRQRLQNEMLNDIMAKMDYLEKSLLRMEASRGKSLAERMNSPEGRDFTKAYMAWYVGDYKEAVGLLAAFIAKYKDLMLTQQARMLLADSYWRMGKKNKACIVLKSFVEEERKSAFRCAAYYKAARIGCWNMRPPASCEAVR